MTAPVLDIAEVVERTGVPASTLHVWERKGLVHPVARAGLRRQYEERVVARIAAIVAFQHGGFTLAQIAELFDASGERSKALFAVKLRELQAHRARVDVAIQALEHAMICPEPQPLECERFATQAIAVPSALVVSRLAPAGNCASKVPSGR